MRKSCEYATDMKHEYTINGHVFLVIDASDMKHDQRPCFFGHSTRLEVYLSYLWYKTCLQSRLRSYDQFRCLKSSYIKVFHSFVITKCRI